MTERDASLDVAKAVAMFAIVLIHVRTNAPLPDYGLVAGLDNFLTTFVLSLFILVSGHLSRGIIMSGDGARLVRRVLACIWPVFTMLVFLGQAVNLCVFGRFLPPPAGWVRYVLSAGWFFLCLAACLTLTFAVQSVARGRRSVRICLLTAVLLGLWALPVGVCHVKDMIVYFWFGAYAYPTYARLPHRRVIGFAALAVSLGLCLALPDFREIGLFVHDAPMPLGTFSWKGCGLSLAKYALGLSAALGVLELSRAVARRIGHSGSFVALGARTMGIFFIHLQLLAVWYATVGWAGGGFAGRLGLTVVLFLLSFGLTVLTRMNPVVGALLWNPLELGRLKRERGKGGA